MTPTGTAPGATTLNQINIRRALAAGQNLRERVSNLNVAEHLLLAILAITIGRPLIEKAVVDLIAVSIFDLVVVCVRVAGDDIIERHRVGSVGIRITC